MPRIDFDVIWLYNKYRNRDRMNQSGVLNLSKLTSQEDAQTQAEKISMYISPSGEFVKANAVEFLNAAYD